MAIKDALHALVHDYPGGPGPLAARMKIAESTLRSMANPHCTTHGWPLERYLQAMTFANDMRPLEATCVMFGGVFVKTAPMGDVADRDLYELATRLGADFGDVVAKMRGALDAHGDGGARVTQRELREFDLAVYELQACVAELRERFVKRSQQQPVQTLKAL